MNISDRINEQNENQFKKTCPTCGKEQFYTHRSNFYRARRGNSPCPPCKSNSKEYKENMSKASMGRTHSEEAKRKISIAHKGKIIPDDVREKISINTKAAMKRPEVRERFIAASKKKMSNPEVREKISKAHIEGHKSGRIVAWSKGKTNVYSEEMIKRLSESHKGQDNRSGCKHSQETKNKLSAILSGRIVGPMPEEHKQKHRLANLKRLEKLGIPPSVDANSPEWFEKYNKETNSHFRPKTFSEIGYSADGYDEEKHVWIEYDTDYHNAPKQAKKDLIRQKNIVKYFEEIGEPLVEFKRYIVWEDKLKTVYSGYVVC